MSWLVFLIGLAIGLFFGFCIGDAHGWLDGRMGA
jgi:hypothetical protein